MKRPIFKTVDEYIESYPGEVQEILQKLRKMAREIVPDVEETISYGIPTFKRYGKYVVYIAAYANHIGVYPIPPGDESFQKLVAPYAKGKGTLQFPLSQPIPYDVIQKVIKQSVMINEERFKKK